MASAPVPNAAQLTLHWSGPSRQWAQVIGVIGSPSLPTIDQALAETLFTAIKGNASWTALMAIMSTAVSFTSISIRSLVSANQPAFTSTGTAVAGAAAADPLPLNVAACITQRTALAGKSFRGRTYFAGFAETQNGVDGRMAAGVNTACVGAMNAIAASLQASSMFVGVVSSPRNAKTIPAKTITAKSGFVTRVTAFEGRNTKWESQRRRTGRT